MKTQAKMLLAMLFGLLFLLLIIMLRTVNVEAIGPNGTSIGFSKLNGSVRDAVGTHMFWYYLTEVIGVLAILLAAAFAALGVYQLVKRKNVLKVDKTILALGGLYIIVIILYVLFEKVIVNYRPVIMSGETEPEASFPSTHTMLICVILGSAAIALKRYLKDEKAYLIAKAVCIGLIALTVVGRLLSGVHWFTDIIGGLLISAALVLTFDVVNDLLRTKKKKHTRTVIKD